MKNTPINYDIVNKIFNQSGIEDVSVASIRKLVKLVNDIEQATNQKFVRMEMGVPGLDPTNIGINAEIEALKRNVSASYPMLDGIEPLKDEMFRFVKSFLNVDVKREHCYPTVGSMMGAMAVFLVLGRREAHKDTILFIDPGFPVQKKQVEMIGLKYKTFDVYDYRGDKLEAKLEEYLKEGNISTFVYSNPNNPSWITFTPTELQIIAKMAKKYDVIVLEDLAYLGMDFRSDYSKPNQLPYQPTIANYMDNYVLLISSSKIFTNAGQRIGFMAVSDKIYERKFPDLLRFFDSDDVGSAIIFGALYNISTGVTHSAQYGFAAMLKAANDGEFDFIDAVKEYGERAKTVKRLFLENGFRIVYDKDEDKPIADGFFFTFAYKDMSSAQLIEELLYYGLSAISLTITGSERHEGLRACVSQVTKSQFGILEERLKKFNQDH